MTTSSTSTPTSLAGHLAHWCGTDEHRTAVAAVLARLAAASVRLEEIIASGAAHLAQSTATQNAGGDEQKTIDVVAHELFLDELAGAPVSAVLSEEADRPELLDATAPIAVAVDPLDGSSNITTNAPVGTIFSLLPSVDGAPGESFFTAGTNQLAAGFVVYGPATMLALTVGDGTHVFVLDRRRGEFVLSRTAVAIPSGTREFAINASNRRHWHPNLRAYVDELLAGTAGPRGEDFNMRWMAALVVEAYRILLRGGIFLYPGDDRPGYEDGRLRLVYEAFPVAYLIEQAGGAATNGADRLLEQVATSFHQRTPLVFGSADKVDRVGDFRHALMFEGDRSPLFAHRGLFRT